MNNKIEAARELRLWITQIITPGIIIGAIVFTNPLVKDKLSSMKAKIKRVFKK